MRLFDSLIEQSRKPKGFVGNFMLKIMNKQHKTIFDIGIKNIVVFENCKLLDLGFGGGMALKSLSKRYKDIKLYGVDFSKESLEITSKYNRKDIENGKMKLFLADIGEMPFYDNFFDVITAFQTHYHWQNIENKFKEIYRVLNSNGQFIIVAEKYKINYHMDRYGDEYEIKKLFEDIGFEQIEYGETKYNVYIKGIK